MSIPAYYLRTADSNPVFVHVRLHKHFGQIGDIKGSRTYPAETENLNPRIVFCLLEITPISRNAIVSFSATEAYRLDHLIPPDDEFQTAWVQPIPQSELDANEYPYPPPPGTV
jgi:hypothetical protein